MFCFLNHLIPHDEDNPFELVPELVEHDKDANVYPSLFGMSWDVTYVIA